MKDQKINKYLILLIYEVLCASHRTTHPNDRQVVFESTLGFSSVLNRVWHPEKGTSLNKIFPVALFKKS